MGGASIPLPALDLRPMEQPDLLGMAGKAAQLRNMQQQFQGGQLENQQRQQQLKDSQAMTQAMLNWEPKTQDYDQLAQSVLQNGGSAAAATAVRTHGLEARQKTLEIAKLDAENGTKHLENLGKRNDLLLGHLSTVTDGPDEGIGQRLTTATQQAVQDRLIDDSHAQQILQFAQMPAVQLRPALTTFEKSLQGEQVQFDRAMKERAQNAAEWKEAGQGTLTNVRTGETKQGTAPVDQAEMQDWLQKNPGKGPADFMAYKAKLVPAYNFNLQQGAGQSTAPLNPKQEATAQAILDGRMTPPSSFALKTPYWQNIMGSVFEKDPEFSEQRAQLRKNYTVPQGNNAATQINAINTAMGHVGVLGDAVTALNNGDVRMLNSIANRLGVETGKDAVTTYNTIAHRVAPELMTAYSAVKSQGETELTQSDFDASKGAKQLVSNVAVTARLMRSKIGSLENQWNQNKSGTMPAFQDRFIMPEAKQSLDKWAPTGGANTQQGGHGGGPQQGYVRIKASDGSLHDIPQANLGAARQRDPNLKVMQ